MSDIKDIEAIVKSDQEHLEKLEAEFKEKTERVLNEVNELIQSSSVLKRLSDINEHINKKINENTDWKNKPFVGSWSYSVWPDSFETFKHLTDSDRERKKKGEIARTTLNATFDYVSRTEKSFWKRSKLAYKVDISLTLYDDLTTDYWAFNFGSNRRGGFTEREFWEEFKKEIADRWK